MSLAIENILDIMDYEGEEELALILSDFICQKNDEIQTFLKDKAIEFAKKKLSITYIVTDGETGDLLGYFTLAHKVLEVPATGLSNTVRRKMSRYSTLDNRNDSYMVSAFLLAQFGKNYNVEEQRRVSGAELMDCVDEVLKSIQHQIGGAVVYLDCEDKKKLITFYRFKNKRSNWLTGIVVGYIIRKIVYIKRECEMTIRDRIFSRISELEITQKEFSKRTGIPETTVSDWKKKKTNPTAEKILVICKVLNVTPEWLLSGVETHGTRSNPSKIIAVDAATEAGELMELFNSSDAATQARILGYAQALGKIIPDRK